MGTLDDLRARFRPVERKGSEVVGGIKNPLWTSEQLQKFSGMYDVISAGRVPAKSRGSGGDRFEVIDLRMKFGGPLFEGHKMSDLAVTNRGALRWLHEQGHIAEQVRSVIRYQLQETEETLKLKLEDVDSKG